MSTCWVASWRFPGGLRASWDPRTVIARSSTPDASAARTSCTCTCMSLAGPSRWAGCCPSRACNKGERYGWIEHLALADRAARRSVDLRHEEAAQHRPGPGRRSEGLQGRYEESGRRDAGAERRIAAADRRPDDRRRSQEGEDASMIERRE